MRCRHQDDNNEKGREKGQKGERTVLTCCPSTKDALFGVSGRSNVFLVSSVFFPSLSRASDKLSISKGGTVRGGEVKERKKKERKKEGGEGGGQGSTG